MEAVLLVVHLIVAVGIIILVLIQPSEAGGFLGNSGSMSNMMMPRRNADIMTRLTTIFAAIFFGTSLLLAIVAQHRPQEQSILDVANGMTPVAGEAAAPALVPVQKEEPKKPEAPKAPISK